MADSSLRTTVSLAVGGVLGVIDGWLCTSGEEDSLGSLGSQWGGESEEDGASESTTVPSELLHDMCSVLRTLDDSFFLAIAKYFFLVRYLQAQACIFTTQTSNSFLCASFSSANFTKWIWIDLLMR